MPNMAISEYAQVHIDLVVKDESTKLTKLAFKDKTGSTVIAAIEMDSWQTLELTRRLLETLEVKYSNGD